MPILTITDPRWDTRDVDLRARFVREMRDSLACVVEYNAQHVVGVLPVIGARSGAMAAARLEAQPAFDELEQALRGIGIDEPRRHGLGEAQLSFKLGNIASWSGSVSTAGTNYSANVWITLVIRPFISVDSLLETLLAATGIGTAVKEAKDTA